MQNVRQRARRISGLSSPTEPFIFFSVTMPDLIWS